MACAGDVRGSASGIFERVTGKRSVGLYPIWVVSEAKGCFDGVYNDCEKAVSIFVDSLNVVTVFGGIGRCDS